MRRIILLLLGFLVFSAVVWAQDQATLVGTVADTSGAVIPGAKVNVANPSKGYVRDLITSSAGEYTAARIPIGDYVITVEATGFERLVRTGIKLDVGQTLRVDLALTVGQLTQEVTVSGNVTKVETDNATVSDVVTGNQVEELNLNGRNYQALTMLTPGSVQDNASDLEHVGHGSNASLSFNGNREEYNNFEMDGGQLNDSVSGGPSPTVFPNVDAIAEFRITTSNYGADIGYRAGAVIQVASKSGTKDWHGTAYEFVRNDSMDANDFFINRQPWSGLDPAADCGGNPAGPCNAPKTPLKWNMFGYNVGGPFYIPGVYNTSKTKTFFFWSESWVRYREGTVIGPANVPTARMRNGDFSECDPSSANYNAVAASNCALPTNPATGLPMDTLAGAGYSLDPNAQVLIGSLVPLPNNGIDSYVAAHSVPTNYRQENIRVDQNIDDKTSVFVRFTQDTWTQDLVPTLWSGAVFDTAATDWAVPAKSIVMHLTRSFKPNLMNEFVLTYGNDPHDINAVVGPSSPDHSITKPSTWTANNFFAPNAKNPLLPGINVSGGTPFSFFEGAGTSNWSETVPEAQLRDDLAYTVNKHTLKMGLFIMDYHDDEPNVEYPPQGGFTFTGGGPITTGNGLADMFLGRIQQYTEGTFVSGGTPIGGWGWARWRRRSFEPYFQDDWKVNRRLTLNLGLRYYYYSPDHDVSHPTVDSNFYPTLYNPAAEAQLDINGNFIPGSGYNFTEYGNGLVQCGVGGITVGCRNMPENNWAPRFGFAYDPTGTGKTAIRGGFGVYYELGTGGEGNTEGAAGDPPSVQAPSGFNILGYTHIVPGLFGPGSYAAFPRRGPGPSIYQYNVTLQHEFAGNNFLSVAWVGNQGRHLSRRPNLNHIPYNVGTENAPALAGTTDCDASGNCNVQQILMNQIDPSIFFVPYRGYGPISLLEYAASCRYNSLQANYRHSVGHGLTLQAAYTWAHGIDNASGPYAEVNGGEGVDDANLNRWYASSDFNRTQTLVANYIYDLPFFKNSPSRVAKQTLGGWEFSGISSFFTGIPVDMTCGATGMSSGIGQGMRCNTLGPLKIDKTTYDDPQFGPTAMWFNPNMVAQPLLSQYSANGEAGMFGYMGRNLLTGPGRNNWDLALLKNFQLPWARGEHSTLQFRLETFNTFNHPQWKFINASCGGGTPFGAPCSGVANNLGNGEVNGAWAPRNVQLGLKFLF